jgi:hypothetical protein
MFMLAKVWFDSKNGIEALDYRSTIVMFWGFVWELIDSLLFLWFKLYSLGRDNYVWFELFAAYYKESVIFDCNDW